jgi:hypothetical protein
MLLEAGSKVCDEEVVHDLPPARWALGALLPAQRQPSSILDVATKKNSTETWFSTRY